MAALYCSVYILLFTYIIIRSPFFKLPGFSSVHTLIVFYLKLGFGAALWYIYTYHYHNRLTSDVFKYYDDSKIMYNAWHHHFGDFIKMLTGIGDSPAHIGSYYKQMNSWGNSYGSTIYNNSHFIIRLNALLLFLSDGYYGVHVIIFCFLSLVGLALIYKSFYPALSDTPKLLFAAVFLFPSVLLWGSGVLKESLVLFGLGLSIRYFQKLLLRLGRRVRNIIFLLFGMFLLFENKAYVLICILPCFMAWLTVERINLAKKHPLITYLVITILYLVGGLMIGKLKQRYNPVKMIATKQEEFNRITRGGLYLIMNHDSAHVAYLPVTDTAALHPASPYADSLLHHAGVQYLATQGFGYHEKTTHHCAYFTLQKDLPFVYVSPYNKDTIKATANDSDQYEVYIYDLPAKSRIEISPIKPTLSSLIENIPSALAISLIRPSVQEVHSNATLIYLIENHVVILLILLALIFSKRSKLYKSEIAFCLTYCLLMLVLIGLVTPIYGGIERYKALVMPFLLILLLLIYDKEKVKRIFRNTKK